SISGCGARSLPIASTTTLPVSFVCLIKDPRARLLSPARRTSHFLLDLDDLAPFVVSALRADAVRQTRLLTVRARDGLRRAQTIAGQPRVARRRNGPRSNQRHTSGTDLCTPHGRVGATGARAVVARAPTRPSQPRRRRRLRVPSPRSAVRRSRSCPRPSH